METEDPIFQEVIGKIRTHSKYKLFYKEGSYGNKLCHILTVVDEHYVVYKYWSYRRKRWVYSVEWDFSLYLDYKAGFLTLIE